VKITDRRVVVNRTDVAAVDAALRPRPAALRAAVSGHRSI
jgi:hypothetical protein